MQGAKDSDTQNPSLRIRKRPLRQQTSLPDGKSYNLFSGKPFDIEDVFTAVQCSICLDTMKEPHSTTCGHSFCYGCIMKALKNHPRCPSCSKDLKMIDIFPNESMSKLSTCMDNLQHQRKRMKLSLTKSSQPNQQLKSNEDEGNSSSSSSSVLDESLFQQLTTSNLDLPTVTYLIQMLQRRRSHLELTDAVLRNKIVLEFLDEMINRRKEEIERINNELASLEKDRLTMKNRLKSLEDPNAVASVPDSKESLVRSIDLKDSNFASEFTNIRQLNVPQSSRMGTTSNSALSHRRQQVFRNYDDLEQNYFHCRSVSGRDVGDSDAGLNEFAEGIHRITQFSSIRELAELQYNGCDTYSSNLSIVSSIEFDKDGEYFGVAGVTKKIKIYEYFSVVEDQVGTHYPVGEMQCTSKISCISWNQYWKQVLASSDYEGVVQLWDATTKQSTRKFQEHEKRTWSVQFNSIDPKYLASGSDDAKVKLWRIDEKNSVCTIEAKVNVCCVEWFDFKDPHLLAFGSADHCVHLYDIRNVRESWKVLKGHKKAVSYVKRVGPNELVSACTDSELRLWDLTKFECRKIFRGHQNEKNFVGLATDCNYIACGSETNQLCVYYKGLAQPLLNYRFDSDAGILEPNLRRDPEDSDFVSAVSWKRDSNVLVSANSKGIIKVLELVQ